MFHKFEHDPLFVHFYCQTNQIIRLYINKNSQVFIFHPLKNKYRFNITFLHCQHELKDVAHK